MFAFREEIIQQVPSFCDLKSSRRSAADRIREGTRAIPADDLDCWVFGQPCRAAAVSRVGSKSATVPSSRSHRMVALLHAHSSIPRTRGADKLHFLAVGSNSPLHIGKVYT